MKNLLLLFVFFIPISAFAQYENYKLEDYVNPDYKRQELDFKFNLGGDISSWKQQNRGWDYIWSRNNESIAGNANIAYHKWKNSLEFQGLTAISSSISGAYDNKEEDNSAIKSNDIRASIDFSHTGLYYSNDKKFIEFSPYAGFIYQDMNDKDKNSDYQLKTEWDNLNIHVGFRIGIGKGRIEYVEDARQAVYILQDLQEKGLLKKILTDDEVNAFARQMTSVKMKRQFDSRIRLIEEISAVDSFLVANGYIDNTHSAPYFTSLYDNWMYAGLIRRQSGSRFSVGLRPGYYYSQNKHKQNYTPLREGLANHDYKNYNSDIRGALYADYKYEKPENLYWQRSAEISADVNLGKVRNNDSNNLESQLYGAYSIGYYPNSRTSISGGVSEYLYYNNYNNFISTVTSLGIDIYYYLSPQLRISGDCGLSYNFSRYVDDNYNMYNKYPNISFGASLTYSIF